MGQKIDIINNWNLSKLFSNLENGNFKIPKFQREYVWEKSKIVKLLNSIYKQYPIGSFLSGRLVKSMLIFVVISKS